MKSNMLRGIYNTRSDLIGMYFQTALTMGEQTLNDHPLPALTFVSE